jgi:hypothetical protein
MRELRRALSIFVAAGFVVIGYGALEFVAGFLRTNVFERVLAIFHMGSWYIAPGDIAQVVSVNTPLGVLPRLRYVFAEPSMAANFMVLLFCFFFFRSFTEPAGRRIWLILTLIPLALIVLTFSLSGYVNTLFVGFTLVILLPGKRRAQYCFIAVTAITILMLVPPIRSFVLDVLDRPFRGELSVGMRLASMRAGISMLADYPVLGVGFGNSVFYIYDYIPFNPAIEDFLKWYIANGDIALPILNMFVRMFAETGIIGGLLFIGWHYQVLRAVWKARSSVTGVERLWGTCFFVSSLAVIVGYFAEAGFDKRYWPFVLGLAIVWSRLVIRRPVVVPATSAGMLTLPSNVNAVAQPVLFTKRG